MVRVLHAKGKNCQPVGHYHCGECRNRIYSHPHRELTDCDVLTLGVGELRLHDLVVICLGRQFHSTPTGIWYPIIFAIQQRIVGSIKSNAVNVSCKALLTQPDTVSCLPTFDYSVSHCWHGLWACIATQIIVVFHPFHHTPPLINVSDLLEIDNCFQSN